MANGKIRDSMNTKAITARSRKYINNNMFTVETSRETTRKDRRTGMEFSSRSLSHKNIVINVIKASTVT